MGSQFEPTLLDESESNRTVRFQDLGPSRFHARRSQTAALNVSAVPREFRAEIRSHVPDCPGVYAMVDREETVAYVGKSIQLRERVLNYFVDQPSGAKGKTHPGKEHRVGSHARRLLWQPVGHELVALLRELELIQSLRPRFNIRGAADRGRSGFVYLSSDEAPTLRTASTPPSTSKRSWGPLLLTRGIRDAVERLNHTFGLRDCTTKIHIVYRDQGMLWDEQHEAGCLRAAFGACLSPCAQGCSRNEYAVAVNRAVAFLDGDDGSILERLQTQMQQASVDRKFERAARLRDTWDALDLLDAELSLLRDTPDGVAAFVMPVPDGLGKQQWLIFSGGVAVSSILPPTTPKRAAAVKETLSRFRRGGPASVNLTVDFECEAVRTVASWFRKNPSAVDRSLTLDTAIEQCGRLIAKSK